MRLENTLALTHGKLLNEPFVSDFNATLFRAKDIKRGDLFIAFDENEIEDAILNGAYGIIFDKPTQISDTGIAWIKVECVTDALKRLLRFRLIEKEIVAYETNEIVLKLALQVITETNFIAISGDIRAIAQALWSIENRSTVLFCPSLTDKGIFTKIKTMPKSNTESITIIEQTLFETSFIHNDIFYERQLLSPFFIPYLQEILNLFKTLKINFRLKKFTQIDHFEALFVNKNFEIKEFGTSDKVLIFEQDSSLIESEIIFLTKKASWANIIFILPQKHHINYKENKNIYGYKNFKDIMSILKESSFHFALIAGVDKSILNKSLSKQIQPTLFN